MPTRATSLWIRGVGAGNLRADKRVVAKFSSITGNYSSQIEAFVLPTIISNQPMQTINTSTWGIPENIKLADPDFARSDKVDVLLGAEFYFQLLSIGQIKLKGDGPILQNTLLGWVVAGSIKANVDPITTCGICSESEDHLGDLIEKFWKLEEINEPETGMTQAENHCEAHFAQNTTRNSEGRYLVRLPFCGDPSSLGNSQNMALSRFLAIERRLTRDDTLRRQYVEFMDEYEKLGHMSKINHEEILSPNYVIPHHCIFKPHSTTTKLRVVFDASAKSSSGISTKQLVACNIWFYGPRFLHGSESTWPSPPQKEHVIPTDKERKQSVNVLATTNSDLEGLVYKIDHRNSFLTLQRVVAYVLRFIRNVKKTTARTEGRIHLTLRELHTAMTVIIKVVQYADFKTDIDQLNKKGNVEKTSPLLGLSPFIDEEGVLRVGGRLNSSSLQYNAKFPILLPYNDKITRLIMEMYHKNNLHCGPQALLGYTRQKFWPLKGKTMARSIVQKCIKCSRAKPKLLTQIMGNLPEHRVQRARPFINSGVDFCGPCHIHYNIRGKRPTKAYIAIFCCFATKAVHLELVTDLSTNAFLCALKRFIARRGHCLNIYCDNATNFVGANNQLKELQHSMHSAEAQDKIIRTCTKKGINFKFIPPRAPHFGGLWEAAVKSAKGLLVKAVSSFSLTYEELETTIIEIEAVLNSRPLTEMSSNPNDLAALTPGHFLIGEPLTAQVDALAGSNKTTLGKRWKLISQIKNDFWKRWSREYLSELQQKSRWKSPCQNIEVNRLVAIKEDNVPPLEWSLGIIIGIYKGDDNMARVAKIKTAKGIWKRPIHKLALLPTDLQPDDHPEQAPDKTDDIPAKRSRATSPMSLVILASLLILPIVVTSPVTLLTFPDKPGLHFEDIGKIHIAMAEWKLIIYYDLAPVRTNLQKYRDGIFTLDNLCKKMHTQLGCNMLVTQFRESQNQIQLDNSLFVPQRQRRAALDIVGNVARSLFGVLDSEYAEEMSTTIQHISQNEDHIIKLLRNQTSIINSTLNIIKADQINIDKKFIEIDKELDSLKNIIKENREDLLRIKVFEIFTFLAVQLSMVRVDMQRVQDLLLDVLTDVHHGKVNPLIMTPDQLAKEIVAIKTHLESSLQVPVQTRDFMKLYQLMKVKAGISKDHIIFQVHLPLTGHNPFTLFKILPVPVFKHNIMVSIAKSTNMLAVTPHRDQYFPMEDPLSESCTNIDDNEYLCSNIDTIFTRESEVCACEINLLNNQSTTHCSLQVSNFNVSFSKMATANLWIYATRNPLNLMAVCGSRTQQVTLQNSGIMHIPPGCTLKGDSITIHTSHIINTSSITSYTSFPDLPQALFMNKTVNRDVTSKIIHYENQLQKLTALQEELNNNNILELPHQITSDRLHHMTIGYSAFTLAVILLAVMVIKCIRRSRKSRDVKPPQPLPRMQQFINSIELQETKPNAAEDVSS